MTTSPTGNSCFADKCILLVSPQPWEGFMVSKHHYAVALAQRGNYVYFLNPVKPGFGLKITIRKVENTENLHIIDYKSLTPYIFRYHLKWAFDLMIRVQFYRIKKKLKRIDVLWDFDNRLIRNYSTFSAGLTIFHPVDAGVIQYPEKKPQFIFSVSDAIIDSLKRLHAPKYVINHGLSPVYVNHATTLLADIPNKTQRTSLNHIGYVGNLSHPAIDWEVFMSLIFDNTDITSHLYGPTEIPKGKHDPSLTSFIETLKKCENVRLYGLTSQEELIAASEQIDLYLICYRTTEYYLGDNSHKILEYLATGKPIVSNHIQHYQDTELLNMPKENHPNGEIVKIVRDVKMDYPRYHNVHLMKKKLEFAISNSYTKHLDKMEEIIFGTQENIQTG